VASHQEGLINLGKRVGVMAPASVHAFTPRPAPGMPAAQLPGHLHTHSSTPAVTYGLFRGPVLLGVWVAGRGEEDLDAVGGYALAMSGLAVRVMRGHDVTVRLDSAAVVRGMKEEYGHE
jgi:hypothetical protein